MRPKSNAAELSEHFLVDIRADGVLFKVVAIRSDRGGEVHAGNFGNQSREIERYQAGVNDGRQPPIQRAT